MGKVGVGIGAEEFDEFMGVASGMVDDELVDDDDGLSLG